jgi:AcrR family transcriptional regulator
VGIAERRRRESARLRQKILNAARELFAAHGYDAVTMRAIARKIEYSPTAIYSHFQDKEALIGELCTVDFLALSQAFQRIARLSDPIERLRQIGRAYADFGLKHPNHYRVMFMTPNPGFEPDEKDIEKGNPEVDAYALLRATVAEGIQAKRYRAGIGDAELVAQTVWAGIHGVISLAIAKAHDDWVDWRSVKKRVDAMIDVLIQGLTKS